MKTKSKSTYMLLAILILLPGIAAAQFVTVVATNQVPVVINIATNQVLQVYSFTCEGTAYFNFTKDGVTQRIFNADNSYSIGNPSRVISFAGPATVTVVC